MKRKTLRVGAFLYALWGENGWACDEGMCSPKGINPVVYDNLPDARLARDAWDEFNGSPYWSIRIIGNYAPQSGDIT